MAKRRVLVAWELGGNLGHLSRMLAVGRLIEAAGDEPVWALPANSMDSVWMRTSPHRRVQVPAPVVVADKVDVLSYASILWNIGFGNAAGVERAAMDWQRIYEDVQPDLVVLDTAPLAQVAAAVFRWPALRISNGFDSPPAQCPAFGLGMRGPYVDRLNEQHRLQVQATLERVGQRLGWSVPLSLESYLSYPQRFFDCVAETDPYGERSYVHYVGPLVGLPSLAPPRWPSTPNPATWQVFAYLKGSPLLQSVLSALAEEDAAVLCVGDVDADMVTSGRAGGAIRVTTSPVHLDSAIRHANLVVSYGSLGFVSAARMAGKRQLIAPNDVEKLVMARRMAKSRAAVLTLDASDVREALKAAMKLSPPPPVAVDPASVRALNQALRNGPVLS